MRALREEGGERGALKGFGGLFSPGSELNQEQQGHTGAGAGVKRLRGWIARWEDRPGGGAGAGLEAGQDCRRKAS